MSENYSREDFQKMKFPEFDKSLIEAMFANWNPFPDRTYCEKVGWEVHPDGTCTVGNGWRMPTREKHEVDQLEELYLRSGEIE